VGIKSFLYAQSNRDFKVRESYCNPLVERICWRSFSTADSSRVSVDPISSPAACLIRAGFPSTYASKKFFFPSAGAALTFSLPPHPPLSASPLAPFLWSSADLRVPCLGASCHGGIKDSSYDQYDQTKPVYCATNPRLYRQITSLPRDSSNVIG